MNDLTVIYYTSNWLDTHNPHFLRNTRKVLEQVTRDMPIISVSQKPVTFSGVTDHTNICIGDIGRSHLNIYKQILIGCEAAKTEYVAMAEDDILYSFDHFHTFRPSKDTFAYDMSKLSIFTWTKPPLFSFRTKRRVVNSVIARRKLVISALEERFKRIEVLQHEGMSIEQIESRWGDFTRYEEQLGVKVQTAEEFYSVIPNIVFSHEHALGYVSRGKNKRLGDIRIIEVPYWGRAEDVLKLFYPEGESFKCLYKNL